MNILEKVIVFFGLTYIVYAFIDVIVQRIKYNRKPKSGLDEETKEKLQKLAGIGVPKNENNPELLKELADKWTNAGFPPQSETIPVKSTPITKIQVGTYTNDPLSDISLSRVSNEAKEQIAEIARKDIEKTLEAEAQKIEKMKADSPYPQTIEELEAYEPVNNMGKWAKQVRLESMKKEKAKKTKKS